MSDVTDMKAEVLMLRLENAKLREEIAKARDPQRIGGQADPKSFAYAIEQLREFRWQHATNDEDAIPYINKVAEAHERENAELRDEIKHLLIKRQYTEDANTELRELVRAMYYCNLPWKDCDKCVMNGADMHVEIDEMEFCDGMNDRLRELGVMNW